MPLNLPSLTTRPADQNRLSLMTSSKTCSFSIRQSVIGRCPNRSEFRSNRDGWKCWKCILRFLRLKTSFFHSPFSFLLSFAIVLWFTVAMFSKYHEFLYPFFSITFFCIILWFATVGYSGIWKLHSTCASEYLLLFHILPFLRPLMFSSFLAFSVSCWFTAIGNLVVFRVLHISFALRSLSLTLFFVSFSLIYIFCCFLLPFIIPRPLAIRTSNVSSKKIHFFMCRLQLGTRVNFHCSFALYEQDSSPSTMTFSQLVTHIVRCPRPIQTTRYNLTLL